MKYLYLVLFLVLTVFSFTTYAQNVGIGTSSPAALLDVYSATDGILIPRVALTGTGSASPLTTPAVSTLVYNTATAGSGATAVIPGFYYWNGTAWIAFIDNSSLTGSTTVSNTSSANTLSTTVNGVTGSTVPLVNSISNSSSANTLSTTVNGVAGSTVPIINSNTLSQNGGGQLINTINGVASTPLTATIAGDVTGDLGTSTVTRVQGQSISATTPTGGQVLEYTSGTWTPTTPGTALFTAGTGLTWTGSTLSSTGVTSITSASPLTTNTSATGAVTVDLTGAVPVANGGTGATTAAAALANLGAAPLSGSGNYIQNGTSAQTANFNITGSGTAGTGFVTPGYFYNSGTGNSQLVLNSPGTYYGNISNPTTQVWALGYTTTPAAPGTPVLSWTPAGRVGIGTTTPGYALEVTSPTVAESRVVIHPSAANGNDYALLQMSNSGGTSYFGMDNSSGSGLGSGSAYALTTYASAGIPITYATNGSERMRILSGGNVAIGTTASNNKLTVLDPTETDRVVAIKRGTQGSDPSIPTTVVAPAVPVTSPVILRVYGVLPTPFTVLISWPLPFWLMAFVLMSGTVLPVTPLTVVVSVLPLEVLFIEFTIGTVDPVTPLTVVDSVLALEVLLTVVLTARPLLSTNNTHALPFQ